MSQEGLRCKGCFAGSGGFAPGAAGLRLQLPLQASGSALQRHVDVDGMNRSAVKVVCTTAHPNLCVFRQPDQPMLMFAAHFATWLEPKSSQEFDRT